MFRNTLSRSIVWAAALLLAFCLPAAFVGAQDAAPTVESTTLSGVLTVIWEDPMNPAAPGAAPIDHFVLTTDDGTDVELQIAATARTPDLYRLAGRRVVVTTGGLADGNSTIAPILPVVSIRAADPTPASGAPNTAAVVGNNKWLTIACKFADVPEEPRNIGFFQEMYRNTFPGLDHYWRTISYGNFNVTGSTAVGWYTLPQPKSAYITGGQLTNRVALLNDCIALANPAVHFPDYAGINIAYNGSNVGASYGGTRPMTLDGVSKTWAVTWLPLWCYGNMSCTVHEMGHGFDLAHVPAGTNQYGNPWDVMSDTWSRCSADLADPVYGCLPQNLSAPYLDRLGWIPTDRKLTIPLGTTTVRLERTIQPGPTGYLMAILPIGEATDHYYTLEARQMVSYDRRLPGNSIVIHEFASGYHELRDFYSDYSSNRPQKLWRPGERWVAPEGGMIVHIDAATSTGFVVTVTGGLETRTMTLRATGDTYVDEATPDTNFGNSLQLKTQAVSSEVPPTGKESHLAFDPGKLPPLVARAYLRLRVQDVVQSQPWPMVQPRSNRCDAASTTPMSEFGLTWKTTQTDGCWLIPYTDWPVTDLNGWLVYDVTGMIAVLGPNAVNWLTVRDSSYYVFSSREGANPPELIIDYLIPPDEPKTTTFTPTNDAYVLSSQKSRVFNTPRLQVRDAAADMNAYLKFNLTGLSGAVQSATLRLWVLDPSPDGGQVYAVSPYYLNTTTLWLETGLKWANAPAIGGAPLDAAGAAAKGKWVELDVTPAVAGNGRASFALSNDSANQVSYGSKEGAHAPQLVVVTK